LLYSQIIYPLATGKIVVITAPSGSGKTTLVKRLLEVCPDLMFSISACTRQARQGERHSRDYYFYSVDEFKKLISEDAFVEWEMVYPGKYYGTLKSELERIWRAGKTPLVDIDVEGALVITNKYPADTLTVFIEAPSIETLRERLHRRGTETQQSLDERINKAVHEFAYAPKFDHVIINDDLETAASELISLVKETLNT
jgi:guanylate kinase